MLTLRIESQRDEGSCSGWLLVSELFLHNSQWICACSPRTRPRGACSLQYHTSWAHLWCVLGEIGAFSCTKCWQQALVLGTQGCVPKLGSEVTDANTWPCPVPSPTLHLTQRVLTSTGAAPEMVNSSGTLVETELSVFKRENTWDTLAYVSCSPGLGLRIFHALKGVFHWKSPCWLLHPSASSLWDLAAIHGSKQLVVCPLHSESVFVSPKKLT